MSSDSKQTWEQHLRVALWYVYEHRCAYTQEYIAAPEHVEIDHVVPERLLEAPDEFERMRRAHRLPRNFRIERNFDNVVPTTGAFNKLKSGKTDEEIVPRYAAAYRRHRSYEDYANAAERSAAELIRHGLALAKQNREAVQRVFQLVERTAAAIKAKTGAPPELGDLIWDRMTSDAGADTHPSGHAPGLQGTDAVTPVHVARSFPERDFENDESVRYSRSSVVLHAYLPRLSEPAGTALVHFSSASLENALITFSHQDIVDHLLPGFGFAPSPGGRPFLVGQEGDLWTLQLANVRCEVDSTTVTQLCAIVDQLAQRYLLAAEVLEHHVLRSSNFEYAQRGYRLWRVPRELWFEIMEFARVHDYARGKSEWDVFDAKGHHFNVVAPLDKGDGPRLPMAVFHPEVDRRGYRLPGDEVNVCWDPLPLHNLWLQRHRPGWEGIWDAEEAHTWLARLLLKLTRGDTAGAAVTPGPSARFGLLAQVLTPWARRLDSSSAPPRAVVAGSGRHPLGLPQTAGAAFRSYLALSGSAKAMQIHFAGLSFTKRARSESLVGVYTFLRWFVQDAARLGVAADRVYGVSHALGKPYGSPAEPLLESLQAKARSTSDSQASTVDTALRAVVEALKDPLTGEAEDALVDAATKHLGSLYEDYRLAAYLQRLRDRES